MVEELLREDLLVVLQQVLDHVTRLHRDGHVLSVDLLPHEGRSEHDGERVVSHAVRAALLDDTATKQQCSHSASQCIYNMATVSQSDADLLVEVCHQLVQGFAVRRRHRLD